MKAKLKLIENVCWLAQADSGHGVVIDGSPEIGGQNLGTRPMELILMGLGGCSAMDVVSIMRKQRLDVTDCVIEVQAERATTDPKVFTKIHIHYAVTGRNLKEIHVKRAVELSTEKYCSVSAMLGKSVEITHDYEIIEQP
ncbi:MAG: OsmC family protein [Thiotrichaceae bacterium]